MYIIVSYWRIMYIFGIIERKLVLFDFSVFFLEILFNNAEHIHNLPITYNDIHNFPIAYNDIHNFPIL